MLLEPFAPRSLAPGSSDADRSITPKKITPPPKASRNIGASKTKFGGRGGSIYGGIGGYSMTTLALSRPTNEANGSALRAGNPWPLARTKPFSSSGSLLTVLTHDMRAFAMSIEGPLLHVASAFARGTAKSESLCMQLLLNLLMLIIMVTEEPSCCIRQGA